MLLFDPNQVMSRNLGAGMASGSTHGAAEQEVDPATARAILQSWCEVKEEDGSIARTYTQCAQTWPLTDASAFENIGAALSVLKRACEYLHQGMTQMGATVEQKAVITRVQSAVHELADHLQVVRIGLTEGVSRQNALSTRIDGMAERLQAAHGRLEAMGAQFEQAYGAQSSQVTELRQSMEETQRQVTQLTSRLELSQVDAQRLDQGMNDLQENVYQSAVSIDRAAEDCKRQIAQSVSSSSQQISMEAYQEHARGTECALEQCWSQLTKRADSRMENRNYGVFRKKLLSSLRDVVPEWAKGLLRIGTQNWPFGCLS